MSHCHGKESYMLPEFEGNRIGCAWQDYLSIRDVSATSHHLFLSAAPSWLGVRGTLSVFVTLIRLFHVCQTLLSLAFSLMLALHLSSKLTSICEQFALPTMILYIPDHNHVLILKFNSEA